MTILGRRPPMLALHPQLSPGDTLSKDGIATNSKITFERNSICSNFKLGVSWCPFPFTNGSRVVRGANLPSQCAEMLLFVCSRIDYKQINNLTHWKRAVGPRWSSFVHVKGQQISHAMIMYGMPCPVWDEKAFTCR